MLIREWCEMVYIDSAVWICIGEIEDGVMVRVGLILSPMQIKTS